MKNSTYHSTYNELYRESVRFNVGTVRQILVEVPHTQFGKQISRNVIILTD